jgi:hypothetical protein
MNKFSTIVLGFTAVLFMIFGCGKNPTQTEVSDEDQIKDLLLSSQYTDTTTFLNDGTSVPFSAAPAKNLLFPDSIKFCRRVDQVVRTVTIEIDPDSATANATIALDIYGIMFVDNDGDTARDPWLRPFNTPELHDRAVRYVRLRKINDHWVVWGVTPLELRTLNGLPALAIDSVMVTGCANNNGLIVIRPEDMTQTRLRNLLPIFFPGQTATVRVWTAPADSGWAFLHRWAFRLHDRRPMEKVDGREFTYSWQIPVDAVTGVRHASVDVISMNCLFGDSTATYSARAWAVPYIVTADTLSLP